MNKKYLKTVLATAYLHDIEINILTTSHGEAIDFFDANTLDDFAIRSIIEQMREGSRSGSFAGYTMIHLDPRDHGETQVSFSGHWRIIGDLEGIYRVLRWHCSHDEKTGLDSELFKEYFGELHGNHFFSKWAHTFKGDILKMLSYFDENGKKKALTFLRMLMRCVEEHEQQQYSRKVN